MAKQTITIEVPEGKFAKYSDGKIIFEDNFDWRNIKTVEDAVEYCKEHNIGNSSLINYYKLDKTSFEWKIASLQLIKIAITNNAKEKALSGNRYLPLVKYYKDEPDDYSATIAVDNTKLYVVGAIAWDGADCGLFSFGSLNGVGASWSNCGFLAYPSREQAIHVSKYFYQLITEIQLGQQCSYEWLSFNN